jgi:hypothetical protein
LKGFQADRERGGKTLFLYTVLGWLHACLQPQLIICCPVYRTGTFDLFECLGLCQRQVEGIGTNQAVSGPTCPLFGLDSTSFQTPNKSCLTIQSTLPPIFARVARVFSKDQGCSNTQRLYRHPLSYRIDVFEWNELVRVGYLSAHHCNLRRKSLQSRFESPESTTFVSFAQEKVKMRNNHWRLLLVLVRSVLKPNLKRRVGVV